MLISRVKKEKKRREKHTFKSSRRAGLDPSSMASSPATHCLRHVRRVSTRRGVVVAVMVVNGRVEAAIHRRYCNIFCIQIMN